MNTRPRALSCALAALALVAVIGLGLRLTAQAGDLSGARDDMAAANSRIAGLRGQIAAGVGPPLLDAKAGAPADQLIERLGRLGVTVRRADVTATTPAGRNLVAARFTVEGEADAAAIDRLGLWAQANGRSAILETLDATGSADGKSQLRLELDALVREPDARSS